MKNTSRPIDKPRGSYKSAHALYKDYRLDQTRVIKLRLGKIKFTQEELTTFYHSPRVGYKVCKVLLQYKNIPQEIIDGMIHYKSSRMLMLFMRFTSDYSMLDREVVEGIIGSSPKTSYHFARYVTNGAFPGGEMSMFKSPKYRDLYSKLISKSHRLTNPEESLSNAPYKFTKSYESRYGN